MNTVQIKNNITGDASSHVFAVLENLNTPINTDMDEGDLTDLIRAGLEHYHFDGIETYYESFLIVGSSDFPDATQNDFSGCSSSLECLKREANDIAYQVYYEAIEDEINEVVERIMAIIDKAVDLGYDGDFNLSGSSCYGWEAHNYETDCGICIWSDEKHTYSYNPSLLEGELWAIEGSVNGLHMGACWVPES